jgi:hypothetical protein
VAPIHDRQMVILERSDWSAWLQGTGNEAHLLRALPLTNRHVLGRMTRKWHPPSTLFLRMSVWPWGTAKPDLNQVRN